MTGLAPGSQCFQGDLLPLPRAAAFLASHTALLQLIASGQLPVYRVGDLDLYRVRQADVDALLVRTDSTEVLVALRLAEESEPEAAADDEALELPVAEPAPDQLAEYDLYDQRLADDHSAGAYVGSAE